MVRKQVYLVLFLAWVSGMCGGIMSAYWLVPGFANAQSQESQLDQAMKEYKKFQENRDKEKQLHLKNLDPLQAEGFVLRDKAGKVRAALLTEPEGWPFLEFYDDQGRQVVRIDNDSLSIHPSRKKHAPFFHVNSHSLMLTNGEYSVRLQAGEDPRLKKLPLKRFTEPAAAITLSNIGDSHHVEISTMLDNSPVSPAALMGGTTSGPGLTVRSFAKQPHKTISMGLNKKDDNPFFQLNQGKNGQPHFIIKEVIKGPNNDDAIVMGIVDATGEVRWIAP